MNFKEALLKISEGRKQYKKSPISYPTARKYIKQGKTIEEIIHMNIKRGGDRGSNKKKKLSDLEFKQAQYMFNKGYTTEEVAKRLKVSVGYFYYHKKNNNISYKNRKG